MQTVVTKSHPRDPRRRNCFAESPETPLAFRGVDTEPRVQNKQDQTSDRSMKHSPLQLLHYIVPDISCSANPDFDPKKDLEDGTPQFSVRAAVTRQTPP